MPGTSGPGRTGFADPSSFASISGLAEDGVWYIDHLAHDDLSAYQTIQPENLHFVLNCRDADTLDYEISLSATMPVSGSPVVSGPDFIHPRRTAWKLRRGAKTITSGFHSQVSINQGDDFMSVGGISWVGYLDLCMYPFDPANPNEFVIGTPPTGLAYEVFDKDISEVVSDLWTVIFGRANRPPLTYTPVHVGTNIPEFRLDLGDTTTFLSMLQSLTDFLPGFDFWIDPDSLEFMIGAPNRYGDPVEIVADGEFGPNIVFDTNDVTGLDAVGFTNTGPEWTHIIGLGSGTSGQLGSIFGTVDGEDTYWRLDGTYDAGDVYNQSVLDDMTKQQLSYGLNPVHEIPITIDPSKVTDFWDKFVPGVAIWVFQDLEMHLIDSPHKVVSMDCTVSTEGDETVALGLNQIYDTSGDPGIVEA